MTAATAVRRRAPSRHSLDRAKAWRLARRRPRSGPAEEAGTGATSSTPHGGASRESHLAFVGPAHAASHSSSNIGRASVTRLRRVDSPVPLAESTTSHAHAARTHTPQTASTDSSTSDTLTLTSLTQTFTLATLLQIAIMLYMVLASGFFQHDPGDTVSGPRPGADGL